MADAHSVADARMRASLSRIVGPLVSEDRAVLDFDTDAGPTHWVRPSAGDALAFGTVLQTDAEISFFPEDPNTGRAITVDLFDKNTDELIRRFDEYLTAMLAGRAELTIGPRGQGRFVIELDDGRTHRHLYNALFAFRIGRGRGWRTTRPAAY